MKVIFMQSLYNPGTSPGISLNSKLAKPKLGRGV